MNILVVGGGGREHAIIWKLKESKCIDKIYCAPGNGGISRIAQCVNIAADDVWGLLEFAKSKDIDLTVIGPEVPLTEGIVDLFEQNGLKCFGPNKNAAVIEGSKAFAKGLMKKYGIPTADYEEFEDPKKAKLYLETASYPIVIKADGLAAGKGVIIAENFKEAFSAISALMEDKIFKGSGDRVIIEEYMKGPEVSILAFTDGKTIVPMVSAKDHKRVFDGDMGPNTGGMGTISPNPYYTETIDRICMEKIYKPTIEALNREGRPFRGVLFFGLMLTDGGPKVLEYNCRFGDPETQVVLPRLKTDLLEIMLYIMEGRLDEIKIQWDTKPSCCVILSSGGYPGSYEKGKLIVGLSDLEDDIIAFHSGTKIEGDSILTDGGRVLGITAMGANLEQAAQKAYGAVEKISFEGMHYRKDIAE